MTLSLNNLLLLRRRSCLDHVLQVARELQDMEVEFDALILAPDGSVALESDSETGVRVDLIGYRNGQAERAINVEQDAPTEATAAVYFDIGASQIMVLPFRWNSALIGFDGVDRPEASALLSRWFGKWFEERDMDTDGFYGTVHFMSELNLVGQRVEVVFDFGSVDCSAITELFESLAQLGAKGMYLRDSSFR